MFKKLTKKEIFDKVKAVKSFTCSFTKLYFLAYQNGSSYKKISATSIPILVSFFKLISKV